MRRGDTLTKKNTLFENKIRIPVLGQSMNLNLVIEGGDIEGSLCSCS